MIELKDISGNTLLATKINKGCKRKFMLMKEDYILLRFSLDNPVTLDYGDYTECDFGRFELCDLQRPAYNTNTAGYDYELRLDAYYWKWKNKIFKFAPETAGQEASWNLTASLDVHASIVLRNLKSLGYKYNGQDFVFSIDSTVENKSQVMSYDNINILDALFEMAKKWGCECWVTENIIHFGRCEFGEAVDFEIGKNVRGMSRSESKSTYATRIYAFGSTRNIPSNYRPVDETVVVNGVVQRRLMLPKGTPYVDAYPNMTTDAAIEQVVVFDDVYPRRTGTMSDVTEKEYTDNVENEDGTTTEEKWSAYQFKDTGVNFSEDYILPNEELRIRFESGSLNGMEFAVKFNPEGEPEKLQDGSWNPKAQLWEIVRNSDYGRELPDDVLKPANGDKYVLSGWDSTKITELGLVGAAEQELKERAEKFVEKSKIDPNTYDCTMMSDWMFGLDENGEQDEYSRKFFDVGSKVNLINKAYFDNGRQSRIIGFEYNLDYPWDSPVFTVGETSSYSRIGELEDKVDSLTLAGQTYVGGGGGGVYVIGTNDSTKPTDRNVFSALMSQMMFLRKDVADTAKGLITFLRGVTIKVAARFGEFITGVSGGYIDEKGNMEMESGVFRKRLFVPEIAYNRVTYFKGRMVNSPGGGCTVLSYEDNGDGTYTVKPDLTDADGLSQFVDDILTTYFVTKDANGKLNGFEEMKFRVTAADYTKKEFTLIPRPGHPDWKPAEQMILAQTGNFTDPERQTYILIDSVNGNNCITFFDHANTWDPEPAQMPAWFGKKKGMTVQGINADNYSAVLQNIIMTGLIFQVDEITGDHVRVPIDKGDWKPGKYGYYNRVTHNGSLWLCLNENGTTSEPSTNNPDWLEQVQKGAPGKDGLTIAGGGHWESSKTPYKEGTMVSFANCVFVSNKDTSEPPIKILKFSDGKYIRQQNGGYILKGSPAEWEVHPDWTMLMDGRELKGTSIEFLGSFATPPANPKEGQSYYNTTDRSTYIWQDDRWMFMVGDGKDGTNWEFVYTRGNIIDNPPAKPDSKQQDKYVPTGWTDNFLGVDENNQVEWACKRYKDNGVWSEFNTPAVVHRWSKDGENGKDGTSITPVGHWESSKVPYKKGQVVDFGGGSYAAKVDTSEPPRAIMRFTDGRYMRSKSGGYILQGTASTSSVHPDWQVIMEPVNPAASYWLDCPIGAINFTSTGSPSPSSFVMTMKQSVDNNVSDCNAFYLVARKYNGSWSAHVGATLSTQIAVPATAGYTQFAVRAYRTASDANSWNDNYIAEKGVGVATDGKPGAKGDTGATGAFPYDRGVFTSGQSYTWNAQKRDKIIYKIDNVYYNFLVRNFGATVTAAPTSANGDTNWEAMQKFTSIVTDTFFADGANIAGFSFKLLGYTSDGHPYGQMKSQLDTNGQPNLFMDTRTGEFKSLKATITGEINANKGMIGGFSIGEDYIGRADRGMFNVDILQMTYKQFTMSYHRYERVDGILYTGNDTTYIGAGFIDINRNGNSIKSGALLRVEGGNVVFRPGTGGYVSVDGLKLNARAVSSSETLKLNDDIISLTNTSDITVNMPNAPKGKVLYIKKHNTSKVTLAGGTFMNQNDGGKKTSFDIDQHSLMLVKDEKDNWVIFYCG